MEDTVPVDLAMGWAFTRNLILLVDFWKPMTKWQLLSWVCTQELTSSLWNLMSFHVRKIIKSSLSHSLWLPHKESSLQTGSWASWILPRRVIMQGTYSSLICVPKISTNPGAYDEILHQKWSKESHTPSSSFREEGASGKDHLWIWLLKSFSQVILPIQVLIITCRYKLNKITTFTSCYRTWRKRPLGKKWR